ncbi:hypothetical protein WJX84_010205 [Apatococcus fuscideae]|uniref:FkbM family methyltransferase n=1 Tax=Apatococcus fuscideae TaxID=2026836 RepID=A0AAW1TBD2_9CHLO
MRSASHQPARTQATAWQDLPKTRLPNGLNIRYVSRRDVAFLYREVYEEQGYLKGLSLKRGDTVLDVGANIGLFALRAAETVGPEGRVVCMEPIPNAAAALQHNILSHRDWCSAQGLSPAEITVLSIGASDGMQASATFTCYPDAAGWSTMQPNHAEVQDGVAIYLRNSLGTQAGLEGSLLISLASVLQRLLPEWLSQKLFRWYAGRMLSRSTAVVALMDITGQ